MGREGVESEMFDQSYATKLTLTFSHCLRASPMSDATAERCSWPASRSLARCVEWSSWSAPKMEDRAACAMAGATFTFRLN